MSEATPKPDDAPKPVDATAAPSAPALQTSTERAAGATSIPAPEQEKPAPPAGQAEPKSEGTTATEPAGADTTATRSETPVQTLKTRLPEIFKEAGIEGSTASIWGVTLDPNTASKGQDIVLQKFLTAREDNLEAAAAQLSSTLKWRASFKPEEAAKESFPPEVFDGLGFILPGRTKTGEPVTLNLYGTIKDNQAVFGDLDRFLRWRVGLMEKGIALLSFGGNGPEQMVQIHDYAGVSLFARDANAKKAASEASKLFSDYYPELLSVKYFVNVPGWAAFIFKIFSNFLSAQTLAKFRVLGPNVDELHSVLGEVLSDDALPERYGGKGKEQ